jgi:hypothetical protein
MSQTRLSVIACIALVACGGIAVVDSGHGGNGGTTGAGGSSLGFGGTPVGSGGWVGACGIVGIGGRIGAGGAPIGGWIGAGGAPIGGWIGIGGAPIGGWGGGTVGVGGWIGAGGATAWGGCASYSPELARCTSLVSCLKTFCGNEMFTCFGPIWTSGTASGGMCGQQLGCEDSCGCTTKCENACQDPACKSCQNKVSNCVVTYCSSEASACNGMGAGGSTGMGGSTAASYTCADLKYCCAVTPPALQSACMNAYTTIYPYGDTYCAQVLVGIKPYYCP